MTLRRIQPSALARHRRYAGPWAFVLLLAMTARCWTIARADDAKPEKMPATLLAMPLGIVPGAATKLTLRGLDLDEASEVQATFGDTRVETKILGKQKVPVPPNYEVTKAGDTQLEIELTLPTDKPADQLSLVVVTPIGTAKAYELPVNAADQLVEEKEPNDGFAQAQPIVPGPIFHGRIDPGQNVDVFSFSGRAGQRVTFEVAAARHGSLLDPLLTLYDARGTQLASNDDQPMSADARIELVLPADGTYLLALMDAHDQGNPTKVYRLWVKAE